MSQKAQNKRMANIELLRILAMMMVVMLHFLDKGKLLPPLGGELAANGYAAWILETLSIVAVNVYMLISGFFLVESGFKCRRLVQLLCQVLFYSVLVSGALLALGILSPGDLNLNKLLQYVLPTQMVQYWFVTAYVLMYLFSPLLGTAVKHMKKEQLQAVILFLLLFLSVNKSILPVRLESDNQGYDGIWFICVYLVAAYMRLYGLKWFDRAGKGFAGYLAGCAGVLGLAMCVRGVFLYTGQLENYLTTPYNYNHIFNLFAAISLFYGFFYIKLKDGGIAWLICRIAPYTFGVYLLHEQVEIRYLWPAWLGASAESGVFGFVLRAIGSVLAVFAVGILVDMLRGLLFGLIGRLLKGGRLDKWMDRVDAKIAGRP